MQEFYRAFKQMEKREKKILIPILLEDLNFDEVEELDQNHLVVLQQYLRTHTYLDARDYRNYKYNIEKLRKRILFELPAIPLSKRLIIMQTSEDDVNGNDQTLLLGAEANYTASTEPTPRMIFWHIMCHSFITIQIVYIFKNIGSLFYYSRLLQK